MKLSIITINYNNKIGLEKTIKSIIGQTYKDFEYIVIDGGSNDGSKEIILENESKITHWISEPDKGIYNAMNKGILKAKGEFILFINSGDILFDENVISKTINQLNLEFDFIYGNLCYNKNDKIFMIATPPKKLSFSYFIFESLPHPASFIKRELFEKYFYYNENLKIVSDWEFFIYCICKENRPYKHIDIIISNFDFTGVSSSEENYKKIEEESEIVLNNHFNLFKEEIKIIKKYDSKLFQKFVKIEQNKSKRKIIKFLISMLSIGQKKYTKKYQHIFKQIN